MTTADRYEWAWTMRHPTWEHLVLDRRLFGIDFGRIASHEALLEAMAEEAVALDAIPERWEL